MKTFVDEQVEQMTGIFKFEGMEEIEEAEKEEKIETVVEFGDDSDYFKDFDDCIGNEDPQTSTEVLLIDY